MIAQSPPLGLFLPFIAVSIAVKNDPLVLPENSDHQIVKGSIKVGGFLKLVGAKLESIEKGCAVISCEKREEHLQQQGLVHAGVVTTIGDVACGYTALTMMPEGYEVLSVEFKVNMLRPPLAEKMVATGHVIKAGRKLIITESEVVDAATGKMIAKMTATMIPNPPKAE